MPRPLRIGVDTGGTFTDVVALDASTGRLTVTKTPSTPADPAQGFLRGVASVLDSLAGGAHGPVPVDSVTHGTTVATNQLLTGDVHGLGFVTTEGYESVLEIARQSVPDGYGNSYFWVKPPRIVPAHLVRTVGGRLDHRGRRLREFDETGAVAVARWFRDQGVTTIGVCFLHAYANPVDELRMREILAAEHPEATVSVSCEVLREYREYERSVTTLVDAAVKPKVAAYVTNLVDGLAELVPGAPLRVMRSNGGVLSAEQVVEQPITTVLSGPAAGALGAAFLAAHAGHPTVLTLDGGGTSTDVAVVVDGQPALTTEATVGPYPSKIPMIDIVTVGAGGGSIAWVSPEGTLKVGPRSAGADPGPLCYGNGGVEPTVTDAHLLLGRIPPHLLGGGVPLETELAAAGLGQLARRLGLDVEELAEGILEISAWNQANAIRQITVKRGLDVRDFPMVAFGGSGPLLACRLIDILGLRTVLVPPNPGNVSAFGLLTVDVRGDHVRTRVLAHHGLDLAALAASYQELAAEASAALEREGFGPGQRQLRRSADLRYAGQAFEIRVDALPDGPVDQAFADAVADAFHAAHQRLYGYCYRDDPRHPVEWVNLRVSGVGPLPRPVPAEWGARASCPTATRRRVRFGAWSDAAVYHRDQLGAGQVVLGPAVIEEFGSTLPVHPGYRAEVDRYGNLVLTREDA